MRVRLIALAVMNIRATFKRNLIYGIIFMFCLTLLILVVNYWNRLYFSFDQYMNCAEEAKHYRQFRLIEGNDNHIAIIKGITGVESIEEDAEKANAFIITVKDYRMVENVITEIENLDIGALERKLGSVMDMEMMNMIKKGISVVLLMIVLFMTLIIRINISQSLDDRQQEIAIYRMVGYSAHHIAALLVFENLILLMGGLGSGYLLALVISRLIVDPKMTSLSGEYSNLLTFQDKTYLMLMWIFLVLLYLSVSTALFANKSITKTSPAQLIK